MRNVMVIITTIYCDFEDPKRYREAVQVAREYHGREGRAGSPLPADGAHGLDFDPATGRLFCACDAGILVTLDAATGKLLWKANVGGQINAAAISYAANGKQYVSINAGNALFAFALP